MSDTVQNKKNDICNLGFSEEIFKYLGGQLNQNWRKLGIHLGISSFALDRLHQVKHSYEMALEVMYYWWRNTTTHSKSDELHHALSSIHRPDILRQSQKFCNDHSMDYDNPNDTLVDQMFVLISQCVAVKWKEFGLNLGVGTDKIREIAKQPIVDTSLHAFNVLKMWQLKPDSSHHQLIRILSDEMSRTDLVHYLCTQYEKPRHASVVCNCSNCY